MKFVNVFTVRIIYKNGYVHDVDCLEFEVRGKQSVTSVSWTMADPGHQPLAPNVDEIAAIWQLRVRKKLVWRSK